jgi:hypothetical protein
MGSVTTEKAGRKQPPVAESLGIWAKLTGLSA